ncbi:helix-turn-helix domain-containing protein [Actinomadura latina]|uniref:Helix-turn-helix domain-containing protein n=1 Tax=Actinomadura latina TaxID=163603 RepID=A0A846YW43_9ACTN|nr:helix-turn-helix domain-containing protein [Actinomadura latina]NKZ02824.1 helix-turn-helix domain-containing protein [Actinomadura latina]
MSVLITVDEVPVADRSEFFRQMTATTWVPMECRPPGHWAGYRGEFRASGFGPMQAVAMDIMPITVSRTPKLISQADPDLLKVFLVCGGGRCGIGQGGRQAVLSPAEFAFYDTRRPYEVVCGVDDRPTRVMTFMFPPALLPLSPGRVRGLTAVRVPPTTGLGDLTSQFLLRLARNIDHLSPAEAARVSAAALEVLATRLARELDVRDWGTPEARRHALLTTVQGFVQQHLGDPGLTPAGIAAAHHISVRTLHQLFHDEGLTVAGWIRRRRLERCRGDLADPALAARPVAAIAARWGFSSAADFSRAFRAEHGLPPSEYRRSARIAKGSAR